MTDTTLGMKRRSQRQRAQSPRSRQRGLGLIGWTCLIAVGALVATIVIRLVPTYIDHRTMVSLINELPAGQVHSMSKGQIRDTLNKRFKINNIRNVTVADVLTIERSRGETVLVLDYEVRRPMFLNVDMVASFNETTTFR